MQLNSHVCGSTSALLLIARPARRATALIVMAFGAAASALSPAPATAQGIPQDWSHRQVVFSHPGARPNANDPAALARWSRVVNDPRFQIQAKRMQAADIFSRRVALSGPPAPLGPRATRPIKRVTTTRDWSMTDGAPATTTAPNGTSKYPVSFAYDPLVARCDNDASGLPDFVAFPTGAGNTAGDPMITAYDNLYFDKTTSTGCTGPTPLVYWQYAITGKYGNFLRVANSPAISVDGNQLAIIGQDSGNHASLVLLKWKKATAAGVVTLAYTTPANYRSCAAPCATAIPLSPDTSATTAPSDLGSSPFVDYNSDTVYVGDDTGKLHKFTGVFLGTPAEAGAPWPVTIVTGAGIPSPVFDPFGQNVLVGTQNTSTTATAPNGKITRTTPAGVVTSSAALNSGCGVLAPATVDLWAGSAYFPTPDFSTTTTAGTCASGGQVGGPGLIQYSTTFAANAAPIAALSTGQGTATGVGTGPVVGAAQGTFDNAYYNSANPANPSGHIYACLNAPQPTLVQFTITNNKLSSVAKGPAISTAAVGAAICAPITEIFNSGTDYVFTGVASSGTTAAATCGGGASTANGGCVVSFDVTSGTVPTAVKSVLPVAGGGPSGIVVDNVAAFPGASQIYYTTIRTQACLGNSAGTGVGTSFCAVQVSQKTLN